MRLELCAPALGSVLFIEVRVVNLKSEALKWPNYFVCQSIFNMIKKI